MDSSGASSAPLIPDLDAAIFLRLLRAWDHVGVLGKHPLSQFEIVAARQRAAGYAHTLTGRGLALRDVLHEAIEAIRPHQTPLDLNDRSARLYLILTRHYLEGRPRTDVARQLGLSLRTFHREQRLAGERLAEIMARWEAQQATAAPAAGQQAIPFLAPPLPPYDVIGRDALLSGLKRRLLNAPRQRLALTALRGLPGAGKTTLALALAYDPDVLDFFSNGVLWAGLGRAPEVLAQLGVWGLVVGMTAEQLAQLTTVEARAQAIHAAIGLRRMLLVVDDAWQAEDALAFVVGGPQCAHLLTTRLPEVAAHFAATQVVGVPELDPAGGLALLRYLAPEAVAAEPQAAIALVQAVGGLPLGLVLMGKQMRLASLGGQPRRLQAALEQLQQAEDRLRLERPQTPARQHPSLPLQTPLSLKASIAVSADALDEASRQALWMLALFPSKPNTFSEEAALAMTATPVQTLDGLNNAGLLESAGPGRYTLHQAIADYARVCLEAQPQLVTPAATRMVAFYVQYIARHAQEYDTLRQDSENMLAALDLAFAQKQHGELVRGMLLFYPYLEAWGLLARCKRYLQQAVDATRLLGDSHNLAQLLFYLARTEEELGNHVEAERYLQEAMIPARRHGYRKIIGAILKKLGTLRKYQGNYVQAERYWRESLSMAYQDENPQEISVNLSALSWLAMDRGDYVKAEAYFQEGLVLAHQSGDTRTISQLLANLGALAIDQKAYAKAETYLREGLSLAQQGGFRDGIVIFLGNLAEVADIQGESERAKNYLRESLVLAKEVDYPWLVVAVWNEWGEFYLRHEEWPAATTSFQEALVIARQVGLLEEMALAGYGLARALAGQGDVVTSHQQGEESLAILTRLEHGKAAEVQEWLAALSAAGDAS